MVRMKRILIMILLCCNIIFLLVGCGNSKYAQKEEEQVVETANPWTEWASIEETEKATSLTLGLPKVIAGSYVADEFRTMNGELIEVVYHDDDIEVCVRKQKGEGEDISGDYNEYENYEKKKVHGGEISTYYNTDNRSTKQLISYQGYSWSLVAPKGFWGDSNQDFLNLIFEEQMDIER